MAKVEGGGVKSPDLGHAVLHLPPVRVHQGGGNRKKPEHSVPHQQAAILSFQADGARRVARKGHHLGVYPKMGQVVSVLQEQIGVKGGHKVYPKPLPDRQPSSIPNPPLASISSQYLYTSRPK